MKGDGGNFDNHMGAYDGAELYELVEWILLKNLNDYIDQNNYGLYRDDGLILTDKCNLSKGYIIRKKCTGC